MIPPLLIAPLESLSPSDREAFNAEVLDVSKAVEGSVISIPFPIALYHRFDGVWIPVSDMGSFHAPIPSATPVTETPDAVACDEED